MTLRCFGASAEISANARRALGDAQSHVICTGSLALHPVSRRSARSFCPPHPTPACQLQPPRAMPASSEHIPHRGVVTGYISGSIRTPVRPVDGLLLSFVHSFLSMLHFASRSIVRTVSQAGNCSTQTVQVPRHAPGPAISAQRRIGHPTHSESDSWSWPRSGHQ